MRTYTQLSQTKISQNLGRHKSTILRQVYQRFSMPLSYF